MTFNGCCVLLGFATIAVAIGLATTPAALAGFGTFVVIFGALVG